MMLTFLVRADRYGDENADGDSCNGNDVADAAGTSMMLTFLVLTMVVVMVMLMVLPSSRWR